MFEFLQTNKNRIWAFSNENFSSFCEEFDFNNKNILGIGGGGDQAFSFLSQGASTYRAVDNRSKAIDFLKIKRAMVKNLDRNEFTDALENKIETRQVLAKIKDDVSKEAFFWLDTLDKEENLVTAFKKTGFFYNHSFSNLKYRDYFPYLDKKGYRRLQEAISGLELKKGLLEKEISKARKKYDFIYISNILDGNFLGQTRFRNPDNALGDCKAILKPNGHLLVATLIRREVKKVLKRNGFRIREVSVPPRFSSFLLIFRRYPYVFLSANSGSKA